VPFDDLFFNGGETADAGADKDTSSRWIGVDLASLGQRFFSCSKGELAEPVGSAGFLGVVEIRRRIKVVNPTLDVFDRTVQACPKGFLTDAAVRKHSDAGNSNATKLHCLTACSLRARRRP